MSTAFALSVVGPTVRPEDPGYPPCPIAQFDTLADVLGLSQAREVTA